MDEVIPGIRHWQAPHPSIGVDVSSYRLYTLRSSNGIDDALLALSFTPGVRAYAFTFG